MQSVTFAIEKRNQLAAGTISSRKYAAAMNFAASEWFDGSMAKMVASACGQEFAKLARSPLTAEADLALAYRESVYRPSESDEPIAKYVPDKSDALVKLELLAWKIAQDDEIGFHSAFAKACDENPSLVAQDTAERMTKASRPGEEHPSGERQPSAANHQRSDIASKLLKDAHAMVAASKLGGKKPVPFNLALDRVASKYFSQSKAGPDHYVT